MVNKQVKRIKIARSFLTKNKLDGMIKIPSQRKIHCAWSLIFSKNRPLKRRLAIEAYKLSKADFKLPLAFYGDHGDEVFLCELDVANIKQIADLVWESGIYEIHSKKSEVTKIIRVLVSDCLKNNLNLSDALEICSCIHYEMNERIKPRCYYMAMRGLSLPSKRHVAVFSNFEFGYFNKEFFVDNFYNERVEPINEKWKDHVWLLFRTAGTESFCSDECRKKVKLVCGFMAIMAAIKLTYHRMPVRIHAALDNDDSYGGVAYYHWDESNSEKSFTMVRDSARQGFEISDDLIAYFRPNTFFFIAISIINKQHPTELEEMIIRSIHWFYAAQRDTDGATMQFIKYWSCIEIFFSKRKTVEDQSDENTLFVIEGMARSISMSYYSFFDRESYGSLKNEASELYNLRSRALHDGAHEPINSDHNLKMNKWASKIIVSMICLTCFKNKSKDDVRIFVEKASSTSFEDLYDLSNA